ncbi:unnamed protein product [Symbiodinium necroappetens]|uniref:Retrovirus-related Pol polyprotein from transposon TNT 1-94 n=1 Tax=Symbiodinium necroappetens TaxID=1628268 RepID=A0A813CBA5_9DINO|nr:unnamed protein product [Symbiodinium necroappetens]
MEATQSSHVARPSDLARHEQSEEQRLKEEQAEDQQQLEPPYGGDTGDQATMGLDPEAQRLVSEGTSAEESMRGRSSAPAQNPLVARLDVQDSSPGRRSMGKESEISAKTVVSRSDHSRVPQHDNSESELVPDYAAALSAAAGQESAPTIAPQTVMNQLMGQLGGMMSKLIADQVTPMLGQVLEQQTHLDARLGALEAASIPASVDGDLLDRARLLSLEAGPPEQRPEPTQVTEELAAADLRTPGAGENLMRDDNQNKHGKFSARGKGKGRGKKGNDEKNTAGTLTGGYFHRVPSGTGIGRDEHNRWGLDGLNSQDAREKAGLQPPWTLVEAYGLVKQSQTSIVTSRSWAPGMISLLFDVLREDAVQHKDETSSGLRYLLVACLLVPVDGSGKPVLGPDQEQGKEHDGADEPSGGVGVVVAGAGGGSADAHDEEQGCEAGGSTDQPHAHSDDVDDDLWNELFEPDEASGLAPEADEESLQLCVRQTEGLDQCEVEGLHWRELVFVEAMRRKTPTSVAQFTSKILGEIRELGFPVTRIHSDAGSEFITPQMRALAARNDIRQTCAAPEEHDSNGRIENVIKRMKAQVRIHLHGPDGGLELWPVAARAAEKKVSSDEDNLLKYSDNRAARSVDDLDLGLVVDRVLLGVKEAEENSEFSGDAHERMLTCDEKAEGGSKLSEEAELCKLERDELDAFVGMSRMREHSVEPEAGRESAEEGNESELKAHPEHEWTDCSQTEGLRLRSEVVQKDIEQFTEWLDERQLRLASLHEDVLQAWVDDTEDRSQVQQIWQDIQDLRYELRSLCLAQLHQDVEDVSATSSAAQETVLQTRIISNAEVMSHWDLWESPTQAELDNLVTDKHVVYTASITIESLRTALAFSTRRKHMLITLDIKAAFLNAVLLPRDRQAAQAAAEKTDQSAAQTSTVNDESQTHEIVALIPPRMLITKGVFKPYDRLIVRKAVYGLDQSPRDWSLQRDQQLKALKIQCNGRTYRLFQSFAEDSIWLVATSEPRRGYAASLHTEVEDSIAGWVAVYVDDLLVGAEALLARAIVAAIMACWDCSSPQEVGDTEDAEEEGISITDLRPDISFVVSKLASRIGLIEGFGDASFAPEAKRSMQCVQVYAEGAVVAWSVSRQAFMAQSSCEAEMIALMDLANYTISTAYLLDELLQYGSKKQILGDNVAALAIYGGTAAHWRTREWNPADIGTKSLGEDELAEASQQRARHSMRRQEEEESARDDAVIVGPAEQVEVLRGNGHANPPEPRQNDADRAAPRPRVRVMDYNEVRAEIIRQEADRRLLNFPPEPPIVINPAWGAPPIQPTVRELRQLSTDWGGYASAVFHRPPAGIRNDFYQYDTSRQVLIRWHCRPRLRLFNPDTTRLPAPLEARMLSGRRRTMVQDTLEDRMITDDFRRAAVATTRALEREWWGRTEMQVIPAERLQG